jgi:integrase
MSDHYSHTGRGTPLMRRERIIEGKKYLSQCWYYRSRRGGINTFFNLGRDWSGACAKADEIDQFLRLPGSTVIEARERFEWGQRAATTKIATIGEILDKFIEQAPALNLSPDTVQGYRTSLLRLVRIALSQRHRREFNNDQARAQSSMVLTRRLVSDYKLQAVSGLDDRRNETSAKRTTNGLLRNAKSVFSGAAREMYESHGLILPDLSSFLTAQSFKRVKVNYRLPNTAVMGQVLLAIARGPDTFDRNSWLGVYLAAQAGLRKSEISFARWSWFRKDDHPCIEIQEEEDFRPKGGSGRKIPISEEAYRLVMAHKSDGEIYLISGGTNERIEEWGRRAAALLKTQGVSVSKPVHELRKWFGSAVAFRFGLTKAQAWLGHTNHQTTYDYYADLDFPSSLLRFWKFMDKRAADEKAA